MKKNQQDLIVLIHNFGTGLERLVNSKWGFVYGSQNGDLCASICL